MPGLSFLIRSTPEPDVANFTINIINPFFNQSPGWHKASKPLLRTEEGAIRHDKFVYLAGVSKNAGDLTF